MTAKASNWHHNVHNITAAETRVKSFWQLGIVASLKKATEEMLPFPVCGLHVLCVCVSSTHQAKCNFIIHIIVYYLRNVSEGSVEMNLWLTGDADSS